MGSTLLPTSSLRRQTISSSARSGWSTNSAWSAKLWLALSSVPEGEVNDDVPFMMQVYPIRMEKRALIPAVTHVDGSGRLQTVTRETNPRH